MKFKSISTKLMKSRFTKLWKKKCLTFLLIRTLDIFLIFVCSCTNSAYVIEFTAYLNKLSHSLQSQYQLHVHVYLWYIVYLQNDQQIQTALWNNKIFNNTRDNLLIFYKISTKILLLINVTNFNPLFVSVFHIGPVILEKIFKYW